MLAPHYGEYYPNGAPSARLFRPIFDHEMSKMGLRTNPTVNFESFIDHFWYIAGCIGAPTPFIALIVFLLCREKC